MSDARTDFRPVPDPTLLTTEQLRRELSGLQAVLETRLDGMDKAGDLLHHTMARVPSDTDKQVRHLTELHDEKFRSIQKQFDERDIRSAASEDAAKVAVNAALQAQKEAAAAQNQANAAAITKSEAATVKQIDGILALLTSNTKAIDEKIASINSRLDRGDGITRGGSDNRSERRLDTGSMLGAVSMGLVILGMLGALYAFALHSGGVQPQLPYVTVAPPAR